LKFAVDEENKKSHGTKNVLSGRKNYTEPYSRANFIGLSREDKKTEIEKTLEEDGPDRGTREERRRECNERKGGIHRARTKE